MCVEKCSGKVSVIIPTYERLDDLTNLFESLLKQTIQPFEVIIVDDTPSQHIENLCKKFSSKFESIGINLWYIKNQRYRSAAVARNIGAKKAREEYLLFLDSDVILYDDYIENVLKVFEKNSNAIGVQGLIVNLRRTKFHNFRQILHKLFLLPTFTYNSCNFNEYPEKLTRIINCQVLSGSNMALKHAIFSELQFNESLKKYSYMEDVLLSYTIFKKYSKGLFITPYARCFHKVSQEGRMGNKKTKAHKDKCRKYVLIELFGFKGLLMYYWQNLGILIIECIKWWFMAYAS